MRAAFENGRIVAGVAVENISSGSAIYHVRPGPGVNGVIGIAAIRVVTGGVQLVAILLTEGQRREKRNALKS